MPHASTGFSNNKDSLTAATDALNGALDNLEGAEPHAAFLFVTPEHAEKVDEIVEVCRSGLGGAPVAGATTVRVFGAKPKRPALGVMCISLERGRMIPFRVEQVHVPDGSALVGFPLLAADLGAGILLADNDDFPTQYLLHSLNGDYPEMRFVGARIPRSKDQSIILNDSTGSSGAAGILFSRDVEIATLVAPATRPIGDPFIVTESRGFVVSEIGGRPSLERLREALVVAGVAGMPMMRSLRMGVALDEKDPTRNFSLRGLIGANMRSGELAFSESVSMGQSVQFQLSDQSTALRNLRAALSAFMSARGGRPPAGVLAFAGQWCHGAAAARVLSEVRSQLRTSVIAGMSCSAEIGPSSGRNHVHNSTIALSIFG